jgi:N-dimethylarginine dimethylaminohydrolase
MTAGGPGEDAIDPPRWAEPVRVALLGAGLIGREHATLLADHPACRLVGIADVAPATRALADQHGVPWFADYERLLDAVAPDAAIVALPNQLHVEAGLACVERTITVLVEKPVADTVASGRQLVEAGEASSVPILVGHHRAREHAVRGRGAARRPLRRPVAPRARPARPSGDRVGARSQRVASSAVTGYGSASMWGELRRVLVRRPLPPDADAWRAYGWHAPPDVAAAQSEHDAFCALLAEAGAEVVASEHDPGNPDAIYTYDPTLVGADGAVLLLPGKEGRRTEPAATVAALQRAGVPVVSRIEQPATVEGGDTVWLDERTLLVGIGYRTNVAALDGLRLAFPGVEVIAFDLPHWNGAGEVMHLMSFISPLDGDLALVYPRIAPTRLMWLLAERGIGVVEVPDEEFATMGANVLALGPRRALALEGNDATRRRMERAGVDVLTYRGDEISRKGDGGPTCLTRPLLRLV